MPTPISCSRCSGRLTEAEGGPDELALMKPRRHAGRDPSSLSAARPAPGLCQRQGVNAFAMELMPRITRAQSMDVLSSQANLAGYRAVLDAAAEFGRAFPMMMTAAGTVPPARRPDHGCRRRRAAGDRHGAAAGRRRLRDRRAAGRQGAGPEPRRHLRRGRGRGVQGRPRPPAATPRR